MTHADHLTTDPRVNSGQRAAPAVQRFGEAVLLQGVACAEAAYLIAAGVRYLSQRDEIPALGSWRHLQRELELAAGQGRMSFPGHADIPPADDQQVLPEEDLLSTKEAAVIMRLTERQTRRLAGELGARRAGTALVFDRGLVLAEADRRRVIEAEIA
jgi:hypothetical protein